MSTPNTPAISDIIPIGSETVTQGSQIIFEI